MRMLMGTKATCIALSCVMLRDTVQRRCAMYKRTGTDGTNGCLDDQSASGPCGIR